MIESCISHNSLVSADQKIEEFAVHNLLLISVWLPAFHAGKH